MEFFFATFALMIVGRKLGWLLSKSLLYDVSQGICVLLCVVWGVLVAVAMWALIVWLQPGIALRWIMGYALGAYVSVPNFGLFNQSSMPDFVYKRHSLVSLLPELVYVFCSVVLALGLPNFGL
jgi:hypothetical protein